eukprot:1190349-Prorocentrum_minimum.AAC.2
MRGCHLVEGERVGDSATRDSQRVCARFRVSDRFSVSQVAPDHLPTLCTKYARDGLGNSAHPIGPHRQNRPPPLTRLVHIDRIGPLPSPDWSRNCGSRQSSAHPIGPHRQNRPPPLTRLVVHLWLASKLY